MANRARTSRSAVLLQPRENRLDKIDEDRKPGSGTKSVLKSFEQSSTEVKPKTEPVAKWATIEQVQSYVTELLEYAKPMYLPRVLTYQVEVKNYKDLIVSAEINEKTTRKIKFTHKDSNLFCVLWDKTNVKFKEDKHKLNMKGDIRDMLFTFLLRDLRLFSCFLAYTQALTKITVEQMVEEPTKLENMVQITFEYDRLVLRNHTDLSCKVELQLDENDSWLLHTQGGETIQLGKMEKLARASLDDPRTEEEKANGFQHDTMVKMWKILRALKLVLPLF